MLVNLGSWERERANLCSWILLWIFVVFIFLCLDLVWLERREQIWFVREKSWREKRVEGLSCWAERQWSSSSSGALVWNLEKLRTSTEALIYIQNSCEQNIEQPIFKSPPLSPSVFKPLSSPSPLSSPLPRERDREVEIKVWRDLMGIME